MSEEFKRVEREVLESLPCVYCGRAAGLHTTEELKSHLELDRLETRRVEALQALNSGGCAFCDVLVDDHTDAQLIACVEQSKHSRGPFGCWCGEEHV